ncbi:MAG: uracil phosphoribosyltransferase, partial [Gemmatimonadales bacterium]
DHDTLEPVSYYLKVPPAQQERDFLILDPMLATGGSASAAVTQLIDQGATRVRLLSIVAAPAGVQRMLHDHPNVPVYVAGMDRELNDQGYILPGLGMPGIDCLGHVEGPSRKTEISKQRAAFMIAWNTWPQKPFSIFRFLISMTA